jgi:hypothetical protein
LKKREDFIRNKGNNKITELRTILPREKNNLANCSHTLVESYLYGPLPKLCPLIPNSNQDGRQAKNRKKGGMKF